MRIGGSALLALALIVALPTAAAATCRLEEPPAVALRFWNDTAYLQARRDELTNWTDRGFAFNRCVDAAIADFEQAAAGHNAAVEAGRDSPYPGGLAALQDRRAVVQAMVHRRSELARLNDEIQDIWAKIFERRRAAGM